MGTVPAQLAGTLKVPANWERSEQLPPPYSSAFESEGKLFLSLSVVRPVCCAGVDA